VLYDSPVIIEYLDTLGPTPLLPAPSAARWTALRLQALADGLLESTIRVWLEQRRPLEEAVSGLAPALPSARRVARPHL
jgi:glutathione S-transferase